MSEERKIVIVDTDCGVDDAEALLLLLSRCAAHCDVLAVTCVAGNTTLPNVCGNVLRVIDIAQKTGQVPVYAGCDSFLVQKAHTGGSRVHGADGFGGLAHQMPIDVSQLKPEHASSALVRLVKEKPHSISLVALGPLTNVALAQKLWPEFASHLKELYIMGGNITGLGNVTASAEFNFFCDPEAAFIVLNEFTCPKVLVPWETCTSHKLPWEWFDRWLSANSVKADFVRRILGDVRERSSMLPAELRNAGYHSCDLLAMAVFVDPTLVVEQTPVFATVELTGQLTRGEMVPDWRQSAPPANVTVVRRVDREKLKLMYERMLL